MLEVQLPGITAHKGLPAGSHEMWQQKSGRHLSFHSVLCSSLNKAMKDLVMGLYSNGISKLDHILPSPYTRFSFSFHTLDAYNIILRIKFLLGWGMGDRQSSNHNNDLESHQESTIYSSVKWLFVLLLQKSF